MMSATGIVWAGLAKMIAFTVLIGGPVLIVCLIAYAASRRRRADALPAEEWPEMETDFARMEERVENLMTILTDRR